MYINAIIRFTSSTDIDDFRSADGYTVAVPAQTDVAAKAWVTSYMADNGYYASADGDAWRDTWPKIETAGFHGGGRWITVALAKHQGPRPYLVCTRHDALVQVLLERGVIDSSTPILGHAKPKDVDRKHVLGILPHHLSVRAATITEVPMRLELADRQAMQRGDLTLERTREVAGAPVTYRVQRIDRVPRVALAIEAAISVCSLIGEDAAIKYDAANHRLTVEEYTGQFGSEADLHNGLVRHQCSDGIWTPWLDPMLSTGQWIRGKWVGESDCAIVEKP